MGKTDELNRSWQTLIQLCTSQNAVKYGFLLFNASSEELPHLGYGYKDVLPCGGIQEYIMPHGVDSGSFMGVNIVSALMQNSSNKWMRRHMV